MDLEGIYRQHLDYLRRWGIQAALAAYSYADVRRLDDTMPTVAGIFQVAYGQAVIAALTATDEYVGLTAAWHGIEDYRANWFLGRPDAMTTLPSGQPVAEWMAYAAAGVKALIGQGMDPADALGVSQARAVEVAATAPLQKARSTTWNRFVADALVAERDMDPRALRPWTDEVEVYANAWDGRRRREYPGRLARWQRVPSPGACGFCLMLATRSNYTSADAAMYAGGAEGRENAMSKRRGGGFRRSGVSRRIGGSMESGERYHRHCRCTVRQVPMGAPAAIAPEDLERLMTPDADGNLPVMWRGRPTRDGTRREYFASAFTWDTEAVGIPMPERAPWARDWSAAPRASRRRRNPQATTDDPLAEVAGIGRPLRATTN